MAARKPTGKLSGLTPAQADAVFAQCETVSLDAGAAWLLAEYDIAISAGRLGKWLERERTERAFRAQLDELKRDSAFAESVVRQLGDKRDLGDASAALLTQMVFGLLREPGDKRNPDKIALLMGHALKVREQELKRETLALAKRRLELLEKQTAEAKGTLADSKLSPAQREERMREIFGLQKAA